MKQQITYFLLLALFLVFQGCQPATTKETAVTPTFIKVDGPNLTAPNGEKFFIRGINLGNWMNPEGYMFGFGRTSSARLINQAFCEMVGPDVTNQFWKPFKDNYITREDIR